MNNDRNSPCPGCYHKGVLTTECGVYKDYGRGEHWFIHPVTGNPNLIACDFCNLEVVREEEDFDF